MNGAPKSSAAYQPDAVLGWFGVVYGIGWIVLQGLITILTIRISAKGQIYEAARADAILSQMVLIVTYRAAQAFSAFWVTRSRRPAFIACAGLFGVEILCVPMIAAAPRFPGVSIVLFMLLAPAFAVYSILRLRGAIGTAPK
jgi:hypothetical protein